MKTYSLKSKEISRSWYLLDASEVPLGRLATVAASLLIGKGKPSFTPHIDNGDFIVIVNASSLVTTGDKSLSKIYHRHSGYPGGLKQRSMSEQLALDPTRIIRHAVRGMLPANKLRDGRLRRLKIYPGNEHTHEPQKPTKLSLKEEARGK